MADTKSDAERLAAIIADRDERYGNAALNYANLGRIWAGIIQQHYRVVLAHDLPAEVVLLMVAALKINRACAPVPYDLDHYDDAQNYVALARKAAEGAG